MISDEYSFEKFLDSIKDKDLPEIQIIASREAEIAERLSSSSAKVSQKLEKWQSGIIKSK